MSAKTQFVLFSGWYGICAVLLALMVTQRGRFGEATTHAVAVKDDHEDTARDRSQDRQDDEAWRLHEEARRAWESKVAAWQEAQLRREQTERQQAQRDRVRQDEPWKIGNVQSPRYVAGGPDVLSNINRIIGNARQNQQASEQRLRESSAFGSPNPPSPTPSPYPSQSVDSQWQRANEKLFRVWGAQK
jgi:hypothetical protein